MFQHRARRKRAPRPPAAGASTRIVPRIVVRSSPRARGPGRGERTRSSSPSPYILGGGERVSATKTPRSPGGSSTLYAVTMSVLRGTAGPATPARPESFADVQPQGNGTSRSNPASSSIRYSPQQRGSGPGGSPAPPTGRGAAPNSERASGAPPSRTVRRRGLHDPATRERRGLPARCLALRHEDVYATSSSADLASRRAAISSPQPLRTRERGEEPHFDHRGHLPSPRIPACDPAMAADPVMIEKARVMPRMATRPARGHPVATRDRNANCSRPAREGSGPYSSADPDVRTTTPTTHQRLAIAREAPSANVQAFMPADLEAGIASQHRDIAVRGP